MRCFFCAYLTLLAPYGYESPSRGLRFGKDFLCCLHGSHMILKNPALERISIIMLEQIQTIDQSQLIEYMGEATIQEMDRIERASRISLGMQGVKRYE